MLAQDLDEKFVERIFLERIKEITREAVKARSLDVQFSDAWI
ncbi:MAG: hypothetical protein PWP03_88 [Candidatus Woesearchaeota archaeon]|nr:hypothetical protein [Candidatus Woesearchaeota archaeon]